MSTGQLALTIGVCAGVAAVLLADGGLFLSAGYPVPGSVLLALGVPFAAGALWALRRFYQVRGR